MCGKQNYKKKSYDKSCRIPKDMYDGIKGNNSILLLKR